MITLKLIKSKVYDIELGVPTTLYVAAYKGQAFTVAAHNFEEEDLVVDVPAKTLKIKVDVEIHKASYVKDFTTGEVVNGFALKPKMDIGVADWTK